MFEIQAISEPGGHPVNEDAYLYLYHPDNQDCLLGCVADGQGGRAGGARAAQLACRSAMEVASQISVEKLISPKGWQGVLQAADRSVARDGEAGFATLIGFCLFNGRIIGASSGDSALLLVNQTGSWTLTERQAKNPSVGSGEAIFREFAAEWGDDGCALAMTDGVWKYVGWERILATLQSNRGPSVLGELREMASLRLSGALQDDFTAILITEPC